MSADRHALLQGAMAPQRAQDSNAPALAKLLAEGFLNDPVMDWIARPGAGRLGALEQFFLWLLRSRGLPANEVWFCGGAVAVWMPPGAASSPGGTLEQIRLLPMFLRLCGFARMARGSAIGDALEKNHPHEPHFYLAFICVAPQFRGMGLGSALMEATLKRADARGEPCYLENSNPKNAPLYKRFGFVERQNIAPAGAPPLIAMWRETQTKFVIPAERSESRDPS